MSVLESDGFLEVCVIEEGVDVSARVSVASGLWRWFVPRLVAVVCAVVSVGLVLPAARAFAGWGAPVSFGSGEVSFPIGVAVDQSSGDVFVGNFSNDRVGAFSLSHTLVASFGAGPNLYSGTAVNPVDHHVYALNAQAKEVYVFEASGETFVSTGTKFGVPGVGNIAGGEYGLVQIASDSAGNVYVPEPENNRIGVFNEKGEAPGGGVAATIAGSGVSALLKPTGVAVDSAGHVWVSDTGHDRLEEFDANGEYAGKEIPSEGVQAVAVDTGGDVFASAFPSSGAQVFEYNSAGVQIEDFGQGVIGEETGKGVPFPNGISVDVVHNIVYVADSRHAVVWTFTKLPVVGTEAATSVTSTEATLHGTANPRGEPVTACEFEYASETEYRLGNHYGHKAPCAPTSGQIGSGTVPVAVTATISGLEPDELYHFRLRVENAFGSTLGADETFTAIEPVFGFQTHGPYALEFLVSNASDEAGEPKEPWAASPDPKEFDMQAGSHPFDVTSRFFVNVEPDSTLTPDLRPKDFYVNVPAGFAGSVARIPRCKMSELIDVGAGSSVGCPTASQVGVVRLFKGREAGSNGVTVEELKPVYNMVPPPGAPAELAFPVLQTAAVPVVFQVRSDGDYGVTAKVPNVSEVLPSLGSQLTLWGMPADPRHDMERFLPKRAAPGNSTGGPLPAGTAETPFLTNPTKCGAQGEAMVTADSWLHPGQLAEDGLPAPGGENWVSASTPMFPDGVTGCEKLTFHPELEVKPDTSVTDSLAGLTVDLRVPQSEGANNLATPSLKDATVTLPQGVSIAPSQGRARQGCTPAQIRLGSMAKPECPNGSQVGRLEVVTPLLPEPLTGRVYLSSERSGNKFFMYLVIEGQGVLVKLKGTVEANEQTGQLVSTFDENPQLPFSDLKLTFYGGAEASLATPNACGSYQTSSVLVPWSHDPAPGETRGTPEATPFSSFSVSGGCASGFAPGLKAGMANPVAGAYSPFSLTVSRNDGEQELAGLKLTLPKGLVGKLAGVAECSNAQIAHAEHSTGTAEKSNPICPAGSQVGTVQGGAGPGESLFYVPGKLYLTGPYRGAPYGVVAIVPALAGPFDLGNVVVRSAINIDPHTAQVTVSSDQLPGMLDGIPLQIRKLEVSVNRPSFTLNPTSCDPSQVTGSVESFAKAQHQVSARFQVGSCGSLAFRPGFEVSTKARHTKRFGAFLHVKVTSGPGQANIKSVLVKLPKQLPSRVSTLKGACSEKQYQENPAGCPAASRVGTAIARTPILSAPLTGPAMFVSHGGAAFPDLDIVLQGSGITVQLEGNTNIKHNITTSDFKSAPDVPVSSFELTLPTGPISALAANGSFCFKTVVKHKHKVKQRVKLIMPTTITGQNGAVVEQATMIKVAGCKAHRRQRRHR